MPGTAIAACPSLRTVLFALLWSTAFAAAAQQPDGDAAVTETDKSYLWPALEIIGFDLLLSNYNRQFSGTSDYDVSWSSIRRNLRGPWVVDNDPFKVNQFAPPYQGSLDHGAGRSTGLSYWEASALTFAGSAWWEITGEKTPPAQNDQIASGIAGSFLGEPLFRMARLVQDRSDLPDSWRPWLAAALLSSANGVEALSSRGLLFGTDYALGDNYRGIWGLYANYDYLSPQIFHVSGRAARRTTRPRRARASKHWEWSASTTRRSANTG